MTQEMQKKTEFDANQLLASPIQGPSHIRLGNNRTRLSLHRKQLLWQLYIQNAQDGGHNETANKYVCPPYCLAEM